MSFKYKVKQYGSREVPHKKYFYIVITSDHSNMRKKITEIETEICSIEDSPSENIDMIRK